MGIYRKLKRSSERVWLNTLHQTLAFNISLSDTEYKSVEEKATQLQDYMNKYFKAEEIEVEAEEVVATGNINGLDF